MAIIITLGLLAVGAIGIFLWRDHVIRQRLRAEYVQPPWEPTRCGTHILENGGTIVMGFGSTIEEHSLDENGELKIRVVAGDGADTTTLRPSEVHYADPYRSQ